MSEAERVERSSREAQTCPFTLLERELRAERSSREAQTCTLHTVCHSLSKRKHPPLLNSCCPICCSNPPPTRPPLPLPPPPCPLPLSNMPSRFNILREWPLPDADSYKGKAVIQLLHYSTDPKSTGALAGREFFEVRVLMPAKDEVSTLKRNERHSVCVQLQQSEKGVQGHGGRRDLLQHAFWRDERSNSAFSIKLRYLSRSDSPANGAFCPPRSRTQSCVAV